MTTGSRLLRALGVAAVAIPVLAAIPAPAMDQDRHDQRPPAELRRPAAPAGAPPTVLVRVYDAAGRLSAPRALPAVVRGDEEWRRLLTPEQYRVTRASATERPFCGRFLDAHAEGVYACACCRLPLFASSAKFDSGSGWPSFSRPVAAENVEELADRSHGLERVEIRCRRCAAHLGHVFDDGPPPAGRRHCLNSAALAFVPAGELGSLAEPAGPAAAEAAAVFAGGCFWCTEAVFEQLRGVREVVSGYAGGRAGDANYRAVCGGGTGHAEAVRVAYDPAVITYAQLLDVFFAAHDPTEVDRQGPDEGDQYRSAIFWADEAQRAAAAAAIAAQAGRHPRPVATRLERLEAFYPAEDDHQDFARRHPGHPYVRAQALPKAAKACRLFPGLLRPAAVPGPAGTAP